MAAHGIGVVELTRSKKGQPWSYVVGAPRNRRVTLETPFTFTGPAAGSDLLKTVEDSTGTTVRGTINNCAGGTTPWGTILSGEENFNGYFRNPGQTPAEQRYGLNASGDGRGWRNVDPRFDGVANPGYLNEPNRFGWIVEIDPEDPTSTPVKHTALGRFKHEGANVNISKSGHAVAYQGDDERFDYLYKFVSKERFDGSNSRGARAHNKTLLTAGTLYVAQFSGDSPAGEIDGTGTVPSDGQFDGTGRWVPLVIDGVSQVTGFSAAEVLVNTRAGRRRRRCDQDGPPRGRRAEPAHRAHLRRVHQQHRPRRPGSARRARPRSTHATRNRDGHIIEITENGNDAAATTFGWSILLLAGDPTTNPSTYFAGFPVDKVSPISCPDNVAFDSNGNLWISTDGAPGTIGLGDGLFKVPLEGAERGRVQQFLSVPRDAETCGPVIHDQDGFGVRRRAAPGRGRLMGRAAARTSPTTSHRARSRRRQVGWPPPERRAGLEEVARPRRRTPPQPKLRGRSRGACAGSEPADVLGLQALRALCDLELDLLALFERTVAVARDGAEVCEDVGRAVVRSDEAEALFGVEPLDGSGCHTAVLLFRWAAGADPMRSTVDHSPGDTVSSKRGRGAEVRSGVRRLVSGHATRIGPPPGNQYGGRANARLMEESVIVPYRVALRFAPAATRL